MTTQVVEMIYFYDIIFLNNQIKYKTPNISPYQSRSFFIKQFEVDILGHQIERAEVDAEEVAGVVPVPYYRHEQGCVNPENVFYKMYF